MYNISHQVWDILYSATTKIKSMLESSPCLVLFTDTMLVLFTDTMLILFIDATQVLYVSCIAGTVVAVTFTSKVAQTSLAVDKQAYNILDGWYY